MNDQVSRYPLSWPLGWKRTPTARRRAAAFSKRIVDGQWLDGSTRTRKASLSVGDGRNRLLAELRRLGAREVLISSNLRVTLDGIPHASQAKQIADPGVAVYFRLGTAPRVLACDRWSSAADNMAAIAGHIEAIRTQERYGVGTFEQAFAGYAGLPPKADPWQVLRLTRSATVDQVIDTHRHLAKTNHPDVGGSADAMARINGARDELLSAIAAMARP